MFYFRMNVYRWMYIVHIKQPKAFNAHRTFEHIPFYFILFHFVCVCWFGLFEGALLTFKQ